MNYVMLKSGYEKLDAELRMLKARRKDITEAISTARDHGDLKENAEYHAAREQQGLDESRIAFLESKLSGCVIVDPNSLPKDKIQFGSRFKVYEINKDQSLEFSIVSEEETDLKQGMISNSSPLGRSFLMKTLGETVSVQTPAGIREFEIEEIL